MENASCKIGKDFKGKVIAFGVEQESLNLPEVENIADIKNCLRCKSKLVYKSLLSAHLEIGRAHV